MTPYANEIIGDYQCDFGGIHQPLTIYLAFGKYLKIRVNYNKDVCQLFIDFEKAYDFIKRESL